MFTYDKPSGSLRIAYILAGGKSSRFGSSKAWVSIDNRPQIQRLALQLSADSWQAVAVAQKSNEFASLGIRTVADIEPGLGPVAGVLSGLIDFQTITDDVSPWALFITCDLWEWNPVWSKLLVPRSDGADGRECLLNHFRSDSFLPFPCVIHRRTLPAVKNAFDGGCRSLRELLTRLGKSVDVRDLSTGLHPQSFNTPEDLKRLTTGGS